ncbi:hypothetical protein ACB092_12G003800 [Castanea dentata]
MSILVRFETMYNHPTKSIIVFKFQIVSYISCDSLLVQPNQDSGMTEMSRVCQTCVQEASVTLTWLPW